MKIIYSFSESKILAKKVATQLNSEFSELEAEQFPDGESYIRLTKNPKGKDVIFIISFAHEPNKRIIETLLAASAARDLKAKKIILIATYLPYMRQDFRFHDGEAISARMIIPAISMLFDKVYAVDPHLHRIKDLESLAPNAHVLTTRRLLAEYAAKNFRDYKIVGPDEESSQWDSLIAKALHRESTILKKQRLSSYKVKIQSKALGKKVLIIDDIISTGRTILETISTAKKHGAEKIAVIGIHGIFANNCDKIISKQAELITTNTIQNKYAKIDISPIISELLENL